MAINNLTNWEDIYKNTFANESRDFSIGSETDNSDAPYGICSLKCSFNITDITDNIDGITVSSLNNSLVSGNSIININPTISTIQNGNEINTPDRTDNQVLSWNGDFLAPDISKSFYTKGLTYDYVLNNIFIQSPSKFLYKNKRYPFEIGMVYYNKDIDKYVILITPLTYSNDNNPISKNESDVMFNNLLLQISYYMPDSQNTKHIPNFKWTPSVFLPNKDKRKFIKWTDTVNPSISYIVFFGNESIKSAPVKFYQTFTNKLFDNSNHLKLLMSKEPTFINHSINMEINENIIYSSLSTPFQQTNITSVLTDRPLFTITDKNVKPDEQVEPPLKHRNLLNTFTIALIVVFGVFVIFVLYRGYVELSFVSNRTKLLIEEGVIYRSK